MDINDAWKSTCKVLLGEEIGDMKRYEKYLMKHVEPNFEKPSYLSQKPVTLSTPDFCPQARFISNEETERYGKELLKKPFDINAIKDIDSLIQAAGERAAYGGNIVIGNSSHVEQSNDIIDSHIVYRSSQVAGCQYIGYSSMVRFGDYQFGTNWSGESHFILKGFATYVQTRCMETLDVWTSSDAYYCSGLEGCADCLFTFGRRNGHHLIGNVQMEKEEYQKRKKELVAQMRETLERQKELPTIIDIIRG